MMVKSIRINNFKTVVNSSINLGRVNVISGADGNGQRNYLEAIAFASAAYMQELDDASLLGRGIRATGPSFILPAFEGMERPDNIRFEVDFGDRVQSLQVEYQDEQWKQVLAPAAVDAAAEMISLSIWQDDAVRSVSEFFGALWAVSRQELKEGMYKALIQRTSKEVSAVKSMYSALLKPVRDAFSSFLIFSPQEDRLRDRNLVAPVGPLGIHGEGLFRFLEEQWKAGNRSLFERLNEGLALLYGPDENGVTADRLPNEAEPETDGCFLADALSDFDRRSTREGFWSVLFYLTLFHSKKTPSFFAVDRIESSFSPELCTQLVKYLIGVAKENDKQVILTTLSPFVLDALDLKDEDQCLLLVGLILGRYNCLFRFSCPPEYCDEFLAETSRAMERLQSQKP